MMVDSLPGWNVMWDGQRNLATPYETMVNPPTGQNVMQDGQKLNNTWQDDGWLTLWTKCDARWSEIQQHLVRWWSTHSLDEKWCKMVRNSTTPYKTMVDSPTGGNVMRDGQKCSNTLWDHSWLTCWMKCHVRWSEKFNNTLQDNSQLTNWMKCHVRWSEIPHLVRQRLTHCLDEIWCEAVRNSATPCKTAVNSPTGHNVMQDGQKFNTLQDYSWLTSWMKCDVRWSEIQQHLARQWSTHSLDEMQCKMAINSITPCETKVDSLSGWNFAPYYWLLIAPCHPPTLTG